MRGGSESAFTRRGRPLSCCRIWGLPESGKLRGVSKVVTIACSVLLLTACRRDMQNRPKYKPLGESKFLADGRDSRPLPQGVIARNELDEDDAFHTGDQNGKFVENIPRAGHCSTADARTGSLRHLLQSLPWPDGRRQWHDSPARLLGTVQFTYGSSSRRAAGIYLSGNFQRVWRHAGLPRPDSGRGPLGNCGVYPCFAAEPGRHTQRRPSGCTQPARR